MNIVGSVFMKKILLFFILLFLLLVTPVKASKYEEYNRVDVQYKLEEDSSKKKNEDEEPNFAFFGMLVVAFAAISIFVIAYKADDGIPDE